MSENHFASWSYVIFIPTGRMADRGEAGLTCALQRLQLHRREERPSITRQMILTKFPTKKKNGLTFSKIESGQKHKQKMTLEDPWSSLRGYSLEKQIFRSLVKLLKEEGIISQNTYFFYVQSDCLFQFSQDNPSYLLFSRHNY